MLIQSSHSYSSTAWPAGARVQPGEAGAGQEAARRLWRHHQHGHPPIRCPLLQLCAPCITSVDGGCPRRCFPRLPSQYFGLKPGGASGPGAAANRSVPSNRSIPRPHLAAGGWRGGLFSLALPAVLATFATPPAKHCKPSEAARLWAGIGTRHVLGHDCSPSPASRTRSPALCPPSCPHSNPATLAGQLLPD